MKEPSVSTGVPEKCTTSCFMGLGFTLDVDIEEIRAQTLLSLCPFLTYKLQLGTGYRSVKTEPDKKKITGPSISTAPHIKYGLGLPIPNPTPEP